MLESLLHGAVRLVGWQWSPYLVTLVPAALLSAIILLGAGGRLRRRGHG